MLLPTLGAAQPLDALGRRLEQLLGSGGRRAVLLGRRLFRQTDWLRPAPGWLGRLAAWLLLAPLAFGPRRRRPGQPREAVVLPAPRPLYAAVLLERRMVGAGLVALVLFGLAIADHHGGVRDAARRLPPTFGSRF